MKRIRNLIIISIMSIIVFPLTAKADGIISNFEWQCDKSLVSAGETVKCHLLGLVQNSEAGGKDVKYIMTRIEGEGITIKSTGSDSGLTNAFTRINNEFSTANPATTVPRDAGAKCAFGHKLDHNLEMGCSDLFKTDGTNILNDPDYGHGITKDHPEKKNYNEFGWWELEVDPAAVTSDAGCARICVFVDTLLDGQGVSSAAGALNPSSDNGCVEIHFKSSIVCGVKGGKYYNINGEEVASEEEMVASCSCHTKDGKYYDRNGEQIDEEEFNKVCNPKCRCDSNGQCYDDTGKPVTPDEYKEKCGCRIEEGKYYDDQGNETTEEEFNRKCNPRCRCDANGQCYDSKGKPVTPEEYKKACGCRKEDGKFYDFDGNEVDEKTWNAKCVPKTGGFVPYVTLGALLIAGYGLLNLIKYYSMNKKIYKV